MQQCKNFLLRYGLMGQSVHQIVGHTILVDLNNTEKVWIIVVFQTDHREHRQRNWKKNYLNVENLLENYKTLL